MRLFQQLRQSLSFVPIVAGVLLLPEFSPASVMAFGVVDGLASITWTPNGTVTVEPDRCAEVLVLSISQGDAIDSCVVSLAGLFAAATMGPNAQVADLSRDTGLAEGCANGFHVSAPKGTSAHCMLRNGRRPISLSSELALWAIAPGTPAFDVGNAPTLRTVAADYVVVPGCRSLGLPLKYSCRTL